MTMPGRTYNAGNEYRYGFNGIEKANEITGSGDHYTAEFGEYDSKIGRRWNRDPKPNASQSVYSLLNNNPIYHTDVLLDSPVNITTANGAYGQIDNEVNQLEFYKSSENYTVGEKSRKTPAKEGQLRSFTNALGTFKAKWVEKDGNLSFSGYLNDNNQTCEAALQEYNSIWSKVKSHWINQAFKSYQFSEQMRYESERDPVGFNLKLVTSMLTLYTPGAGGTVGGCRSRFVTSLDDMSAMGAMNTITREQYVLLNTPYASRIYERMLQGGAGHNFPYSFDRNIILYGTRIKVSDSYTVFEYPGFMANKINEGTVTDQNVNKSLSKDVFYQLGFQNGEVTHRSVSEVSAFKK